MLTKLFRDTVFTGLTDAEITEVVGCEMKRRGRVGVMYFFPIKGGDGCFTSVAPADITDLSAARQLAHFALYANESISETPREPSAIDEGYVA